MSRQPTPGNIEASFTFTERQRTPPVESEASFRIALLGDFSARAARALDRDDPAPPRSVRVDIDTFDAAMASLAPRFTAHTPAGPLDIAIGTLDAFHPDGLLHRVPALREADGLRRRMSDPSSFADAAAELRARVAGEPSAAPALPQIEKRSLADLLGAGQPEAESGGGAPGASAESFIRALVAPHLAAGPDPSQGAIVAQVERAIAQQLRAVLHDPAFQRLEALWRAMHLLITEAETDAGVEVVLFDITPYELRRALIEAPDASSGAVAGALDQSGPWSLIVAADEYERTKLDAGVLWRAGRLARRHHASFIASAAPAFVGCGSFANPPDPARWAPPSDKESVEAWDNLRRLPEAAHICLLAPRFLARLPYAPGVEPIDAFAFTELPDEPAHERFLWAPSPVLAALALARAFIENEAPTAIDTPVRIDSMPLYTRDIGGEKEQLPCAECWLSEKAARAMEEAGVTPVLSVRHSDAVQLSPLRAVTAQPTRLHGPWS